MSADARVVLWGTWIGAVSWLEDREIGVFQYAPGFLESGIELSPLVMPLREFPYEFPALNRDTFKGLPGLVADSLPDRFGNAILDAWLVAQGRSVASFHPVERLCYMGSRGMGALEFEPATERPAGSREVLEVARLVELANRVLDARAGLETRLTGEDDLDALQDILRVGTSAGGARAKAILAWNPRTNEFRSGQVDLPEGFEPWLLKFDGVEIDKGGEFSMPLGYGRIEYAYHLMARQAGIEMADCRLLEEGGRSHFMTRRFDRTPTGAKLHMQTLGALAHLDFRDPASHSYEQALEVLHRLELPRGQREELVRRAFFNVAARNCDDHVKNIAFLMTRDGQWHLAPAYDLTFAYNPRGTWTARHQMSVNGKREDFARDDLLVLAARAGMKRAAAVDLLDGVLAAVRRWPECAAEAGVEEGRIARIAELQRTGL